jgi:hypothetical protein
MLIKSMNRREFLASAAVLAFAVTTIEQAVRHRRRRRERRGSFLPPDGFVLVDGGAPKSWRQVMASLGANAK